MNYFINSAEKENERYGRNKRFAISNSYINSGEYRRKFDTLTDNEKINKLLYELAKKALLHRGGSEYEDMYWIDTETEKVVCSVVDSKVKGRIIYPEHIKRIVREYSGLLVIHTHAKSFPPSIDDFNSIVRHKYVAGVVCGHRGNVYLYSATEEVSEKTHELWCSHYFTECRNEETAQIMALKKWQNEGKIIFREVLV